MSVDLAVMEATNRHGELIAHLASKRLGLGKAQVMRVCGCAAAHEAWLVRDEDAVLLVAQADGLCRKAGLAGTGSAARGRGSNDAIWFTSLRFVIWRRPALALPSLRLPFSRFLAAKRHDLCAEACLDQLGVRSHQGVLGGQAALRPTGGLVG